MDSRQRERDSIPFGPVAPSARAWPRVPDAWADNPHILRWWTPACDEAIIDLIRRWHWHYPWQLPDAVVAVVGKDTIDRWAAEDPKCHQYNYENVLMYFGIAHARRVGLERAMPMPQERICLLCDARFDEDRVPMAQVRRLGSLDIVDYCEGCFSRAAYGDDINHPRMTASDVESYVQQLAQITGTVPTQNFFDQPGVYLGWDCQTRTRLLLLAAERPSPAVVGRTHGSWLAALTAAGVLDGGVHKTARGHRALAIDGHVCHSLAEKTIDDWLTLHDTPHDREPSYPDSNYRADFLVNGRFVEYFGLAGDPKYDEKSQRKRCLAKTHHLDLVEISPQDLARWGAAQKRIATKLDIQLLSDEQIIERRRAIAPRPAPTRPAPQLAEPASQTSTVPAGWYPDPEDRYPWRYWNGLHWTEIVIDHANRSWSDTPGTHTTPSNHSTVDGRQPWEITKDIETVGSRDWQTSLAQTYRWIDAVENEARRTGLPPAPWGYSYAVGLLHRQDRRQGERAILDRAYRYLRPGNTTGDDLRHLRQRFISAKWVPDAHEALMITTTAMPQADTRWRNGPIAVIGAEPP